MNLRIVKKRSSERKTEVEKGERVVGDDAKLAWFWVQGWRARLRVAGERGGCIYISVHQEGKESMRQNTNIHLA